MIAALYVARGGCYYDPALAGEVDPWDEARDARRYDGPWPVVAHPPCARWCRLAHLVESITPAYRRGEDGGTFVAAQASVRRWGGVLEHPAWSAAWPAHDLVRPASWGWSKSFDGAWVCEISQAAYGHRAQKLTWLYYVGEAPPPLDWSRPSYSARCTTLQNRGASKVELMGGPERSATPPAFRDALLALARGARP